MARRYTLAEMKSLSEGHFFDKKTMKFFKGDIYGTRYDKKTGINYLYSYRQGKSSLGVAWWAFDPTTGKLKPLLANQVPEHIRSK